MEMRAIEEISIGEDLTPPLRPLAAVLHDSAVTSHCSACFAALPHPTFPQNPQHATPLYCSLACSAADSDLHYSSAERHLLSLFAQSPPSSWEDSSDLRLSLRLAHIFHSLPPECSFMPRRSFFEGSNESGVEEMEGPDCFLERISGLMTNREKLVFTEIDSDNFLRIREGAKMMAKARTMQLGKEVISEKCFALDEMVLCLVITNAVEVQEKNGRCIGIAVYDHTFSWINHGCSPNSCYRFSIGPEETDEELPPLRIAPAAEGCCSHGNGDGSRLRVSGKEQYRRNGYGPRAVLRSIKAIGKGEEVTIAYTDLLQPKEMRRRELWLKYRFDCSCERCGAVPISYVDYALQATGYDPENPETSDDEVEKTMQDFESAISDYLSSGDAESCCRKLERFLCHGDMNDEFLERTEAKLKLRPFGHLSLNAYTTLASAYKVRASDLSALISEVEGNKLEALDMYKTSSAYSLLLAGIVDHLFVSEPAIVATAANLWINTGESLLVLWNNVFKKDEPLPLELSSLLTLNCNDCSSMKDSDPNTDQGTNMDKTKSRVYNCIAKITPRVWSLLSSGNGFLKFIKNPVDLRWVESTAGGFGVSGTDFGLGVESFGDDVRMNVMMLGLHCCRYGALLSTICYGFSIEANYIRALEGVVKTL